MKAKVFLSCGQSKGSNEADVAEKIWQRVCELGFDCYTAGAEQSLRGLRENIFAQLESSEYFIFIDFKREALKVDRSKPICRGSLFSHQELAIASFLEIPSLILQERGVKPLDGMLGAIQGNATSFSDRDLLPSVVADFIAKRINSGDWQRDPRNSLSLEVADPPFTHALLNSRSNGRFYHIAVRNNHHRKAALYCSAYLDEIVNLETNASTTPRSVEFKWAGTQLPSVRIGPKAIREFDVVRFPIQPTIQPAFCPMTDSPVYVPHLAGPGKYRLSFSVHSQNFGTARGDFILAYRKTPESLVFSKA